MPSSRGSSRPKDHMSPAMAGGFFNTSVSHLQLGICPNPQSTEHIDQTLM